MKLLVRLALLAALAFPALPAFAAMSCSITSNPVEISLIYNWLGVSGQGALNINCTRNPSTDARQPYLWIGMNQGTDGLTADPETGGGQGVNYEINHGGTNGGMWTNTGGVASTSTNNGAVREQVDFGSNTASALARSYTYYVRAPFLQFRNAGVYTDMVTITLRLTDANGPVLTTMTLPIHFSIPKSCRFSTPPSAVAINYPAFSTAAVVGVSNFAITCTQGTTYTIALDEPRGVVPNVNLSYGAVLNATNATGNASGQPYNVTFTVNAGQAGRCTGAVCTGTDTRTVTVTY